MDTEPQIYDMSLNISFYITFYKLYNIVQLFVAITINLIRNILRCTSDLQTYHPWF